MPRFNPFQCLSPFKPAGESQSLHRRQAAKTPLAVPGLKAAEPVT